MPCCTSAHPSAFPVEFTVEGQLLLIKHRASSAVTDPMSTAQHSAFVANALLCGVCTSTQSYRGWKGPLETTEPRLIHNHPQGPELCYNSVAVSPFHNTALHLC